MKTHHSCAELAALRLPGYPTSRQGWHNIAKHEGWVFNETKGQGRCGVKREYLPSVKVAQLIAAMPVIMELIYILVDRDIKVKQAGLGVTLTLTLSHEEVTYVERWMEIRGKK